MEFIQPPFYTPFYAPRPPTRFRVSRLQQHAPRLSLVKEQILIPTVRATSASGTH